MSNLGWLFAWRPCCPSYGYGKRSASVTIQVCLKTPSLSVSLLRCKTDEMLQGVRRLPTQFTWKPASSTRLETTLIRDKRRSVSWSLNSSTFSSRSVHCWNLTKWIISCSAMLGFLLLGNALNNLQRMARTHSLGSVWSFYDMQSSNLSSICPNLLMRILVVDSQPLEALLQASLSSSTRWETR